MQEATTRFPGNMSHFEHLIEDDCLDRLSIIETMKLYEKLSPAETTQYLTVGTVSELLRKYKFRSKTTHLLYHGRQEKQKRRLTLLRGFEDPVPPKKRPYPYGVLFDPETNKIVYGEKNNTLCFHHSIFQKSDPLWRLRAANLFGQKLVIDFSYDHLMREKELKSLANQIALISSRNRVFTDPFDIILTNFKWNHDFIYRWHLITGNKDPEKNMITVSSEELTQVVNPENCIYLSPHAEDVLTEFDHEKVYIIGALVDTYRCDFKETSFDTAQRLGIKSQRFPIRLEARGNRIPRFSLDVVAKILLQCKHSDISIEEVIQKEMPQRLNQEHLHLRKRDFVIVN